MDQGCMCIRDQDSSMDQGPQLNLFTPASSTEIFYAIYKYSNASCLLDPIPTSLLKAFLPSLILLITNIVNLSFSEDVSLDNYKISIVKPLYKKYSLPYEDLPSYRPVSNLNFISKIIELKSFTLDCRII